ncbi:MAG: arylsulfatase [Candidatus Hydrogenedentes bacterium]|nr:arylsulfatase [Candidatus Hydrogenedentota bacterium]
MKIGRRDFILGSLSVSLANHLICGLGHCQDQSKEVGAPNIIIILADDLGYGDVGCYGQSYILTPNIDRLAKEGVQFLDGYAGSPVCAPSRCCLMTGYHTGHARIRANSTIPLMPEDITIAEVLKKAGYVTGLIGKWGLGEPETPGIPNLQGFDEFYGYLNQVHAHNYYPDYLWRNMNKERIEGNVISDIPGVCAQCSQYAHDLLTKEALEFIRRNASNKFFLYLSFTIPHANNELGNAKGNGMEVPSDEPYSDRPWPQPQKNHAAMITRLDDSVGKILSLLEELRIDENTLILFSSDNGPHKEGGADPEFFKSSGPLKGYKRSLYEGGIRVPFIIRWKGRIEGGKKSTTPVSFWDILPTFAELAGITSPQKIDGISFAPLLFGEENIVSSFMNRPLYWEFYEGGFQQAMRLGEWKIILNKYGDPLELYNLVEDIGEKNNLAGKYPDKTKELSEIMKLQRTPSPYWQTPLD